MKNKKMFVYECKQNGLMATKSKKNCKIKEK